MRTVTAICVSVLLSACNAQTQEEKIAQDEAQALSNSVVSESAATSDYIDQIEAANIVGVQAIDANTVATNLANRVNTNHPNCATATAAANVVDVDWSCTLGSGDQAVTLEGTTTITVTIEGESIVFSGASTGFNSNGVTLDSATVVTVIPGDSTAQISRSVTFNKGDDTLSIQLDGSALFDNSGQGSRKVTIDATREVQLNNLTRTQTWTALVFEEGNRLPASGTVNIDGAARDVNAIFSRDAAGVTTIDVTVTNRRGESNFIFTVDPVTYTVTEV